jgi:hypothetical protein
LENLIAVEYLAVVDAAASAAPVDLTPADAAAVVAGG